MRIALTLAVLGCHGANSTNPGCQLTSVRISGPTSLEVGEAADFNAVVQHSGCVAVLVYRFWSSQDSAVARVDTGGRVTGVAAGGPVTIRVVADIAYGAQRVSDQVSVTVRPATVASLVTNPSSLALLVGQSSPVAVSARSAFGVTVSNPVLAWQSLDPAVATVSQSGVVTGVAAGTTTVRVTSGSVSATVNVTVSVPPPVPVASVAVTPATASLVTGGTVTLAATPRDSVGGTLPGRVVTWSSAAPAVAQVSSAGLVTAVAPGSAIITAMSEGKTGTATITVSAPPVASVTVTPGTTQLFVDATQALTATPRDAAGNVLAGETISWTSSAPSIVSVSVTGIVTALADGTATITATARGVSGTATVQSRAARIAYALIDQPSAASHTPAAATQFNGLGGPLTVVRTAAGRYTVTVPAFGSATEARLPFVSAVNASDLTCYPAAWSFGTAGDGTVNVECKSAAGAFTDSRYSLLVMGAAGLPGRLGFGSTLGMGAFPGNALSAWSSGGTVSVTRQTVPSAGRFTFSPKVAIPVNLPRAILVTTAVGPTPQCVVPGFGDDIDVFCQAGTVGTNAPFNAAMLERGRPTRRFATGDNGATSSGSATDGSTPASTISSSGGSITTTRTSAGVYRMTLQGLARGAGGTETVLLTTRNLFGGSRCVVAGWQSLGSDLVVDVNCFAHSGGPSDLAFQVLVIE